MGCSKCGKHPCVPFSSLCEQHKAERTARLSPAALRGAATRREKYPHLFKPTNAEDFWQRKAMSMVASAKRFGVLPELDGTIACHDCGRAATIYEHRDYGRPLDVVPACDQCNRNRGTAIWPSADAYNFKRITDS